MYVKGEQMYKLKYRYEVLYAMRWEYIRFYVK